MALVPRLATVAEPEEQSRISEILIRIGKESEAGRYEEALRWADRASRMVPGSDVVLEILGRLYARLGDYDAALTRLRAAFALHPDPGLQAAIIDILFAKGRVRQGFAALEAGLGRFAVSPGDELCLCARRHTLSPGSPAPGWVGLGPDLRAVGEIKADLPGSLRLLTSISRPVTPVLTPITVEGRAAFSFRTILPKGYAGSIGAAVGGSVLIGSDAAFPPDLRVDGRCEVVDGVLSVWTLIEWAPALSPRVIIGHNGEELLRLRAKPPGLGQRRHTVSIALKALGLQDGSIDVAVEMPNGRAQALPDSPALISLPPTPLGVGRGPSPRPPRARSSEDKVDVIIPVYKGRQETLTCLRSVRRYNEDVADIIVIDDASPDPELSGDLRAMAEAGEIILLTNAANLGFAASVNWGLGVHPDRDCVVLNADAEVFAGWMGRLRRAAYSAPDVGTVTPLTNSGTIASYPVLDGSPCTSEGGARIAALAGEVNAEGVVEAPTGVGFCLYIRQDCRAATGLLDHACFGRGYGEENDFCMRARRLGWRHVIATDVYVRHLEGRSFGPSRRALMERNSKLLNRRHGGYDASVQEFIGRDPLQAARRRLDEARLLESAERPVLVLTLNLPGGVDHFVQERCEAIREEGASPIVVQPSADGSRIRLISDNDTLANLSYGLDELDALSVILDDLHPGRAEIHHFLGLNPALVEAVLRRIGDTDIYIHDYSWICPRISLLGGSGKYCGEPDVSACEVCVRTHGGQLEPELSVADLRARSDRWLRAARQVIAPTEDVRERLTAYFPEVDITVTPWESETYPPTQPTRDLDGVLKVAVIGAIGEQKGFSVLEACAKDAALRGAGLNFVVLGYTKDDDRLEENGNVFVTGRYVEEEIASLIRREKPDVAFFSSVTPETWCFTLSHALRAGLPIVAFDTGAIAERLRALNSPATLLPLDSSPEQVNDALLASLLGPAEPLKGPDLMETPVVVDGVESAPAVAGRASRTARSRSSKTDASLTKSDTPGPKATLSVLPLPEGLYRFSVRAAAPKSGRGPGGARLPAIHVAAGPGVEPGSVEYVTGLRSGGPWLFDPTDSLVAKINVDGSPLFITSYTTNGLPALEIDVERVESLEETAPESERLAGLEQVRGLVGLRGNEAGEGGADPAALLEPLLGSAGRRSQDGRRIIPTRALAHISARGDVAFIDQPWIGELNRKLHIEGFIIEPLAGLTAADIEYKALTEKGVETPWVVGGGFCGTRKLNLGLCGLSVRIRGPKAQVFECQYQAIFTSGSRLGPVRDGAPLRAATLQDRLQAFELIILPRVAALRAAAIKPPSMPANAPPPPLAPLPSAPSAGAMQSAAMGEGLDLRPPIRRTAAVPAPVTTPELEPQAEAAPPPPVEPPAVPSPAFEPPPSRLRRPIGPRFSVFREEG